MIGARARGPPPGPRGQVLGGRGARDRGCGGGAAGGRTSRAAGALRGGLGGVGP